MASFDGLIQRGDKAINERYRPMRFSEVIGMGENKDALTHSMALGEKRSNVQLLWGESGAGKTTLSRILAMGLNCEKGDSVEPCLECQSCKAAIAGSAMHITECNMSALSKKEDADEIVNSMNNTSFTGRNNVWILDEAQGMSTGSQNLMLKMLENPPANTYVFLCMTNPEKIIKPIKTRCEQYRFGKPTKEDITALLASVVRQEMPEMTKQQRIDILNACQGLSYREILMKLDKFIKGGGTDSITDAFEADFVGVAKAIAYEGNFMKVMGEIEKCKNDFDCEGARRVIRTFLSNNIQYAIEKGDEAKAARTLMAFRVFDKGFYTDPNPMPSFKADVFEACCYIAGKAH